MKLFLLGASVALADKPTWLKKEWEVQDAHFADQEIILSDPAIRSNKQWHDCGAKPKTAWRGESVRCSGAYCASVCPKGWRSMGRWRVKCQANNTWSHTEFSPCVTCPDISKEMSQINAQTQNIFRKNLPIAQFFCGKSTDQLMIGNDLFKGQNPKKNLKCLCKNGQNGDPAWKKSCEWEFMGEQWRPAGPMVSSITCKPKEYRQFCITVKSSPDEDLCYHPMVKNGAKEWQGGDISINHNGETIATMKSGTRTFKHCLSMDDVDVKKDVFQLTNSDKDGVCITSLEVNGEIVKVGKSEQPNFWLDGDNPNCSSNHVATPQVTIKNGEVTTDCSGDYCVEMTSSASEELCYHPLANGPKNHKGSKITITRNGKKVATAPAGFKDFGFCLDGVDAENDEFQFLSTGNDGVCVTSLTMGDDQVFAGSNNDSPSFWIDGDNPNCFPNHIATDQMTVVNGEVTSSECDPAYCIMMTSSADEDLCQHPKAGPSAWKGDPVEIFQNGKKVGQMASGTKMFRFCLPYDQVNIENDVFKIARSGDDGVCVTSLSVDGNDITLGPLLVGPMFDTRQPNFWIDGNDNDCTRGFVSTQELIIQNNRLTSSECDRKFCIQIMSSPNEHLCQHPGGDHTNWSGNTLQIKQNGNLIGEMKKGTQDYELCLKYSQVDIEKDIFEIAKTGNDGVCITSLSVDRKIILVGPNENKSNFWIDGNDNGCRDDFVSTQHVTIQNKALISSECDPKFCIEMTSSEDQELCQHPGAKAGPQHYAGGPITIRQNGNTIGSMKKGTENFKVCLDYDKVNLDTDVFELLNSKTDGACITSLTVDGNPVLVGNNQPNFWLDGDHPHCSRNHIITPKLTIVGGKVTNVESCTDFCINVTSGLDQGLCDHPRWPAAWENWSGGDIALNHNGNEVGTLERGFTDFEYCMPRWSVDIENDEFQLSTEHTKGVCVTSFTVDGQPIGVGPARDIPSFWLDNNQDCFDSFVSTTELTVKNGQVASSYCDNDLYCIKVTSGLDLVKCHHPVYPDAAANGWDGEPVLLKHKGRKVATLFEGFTDYEFCMLRSEVDIENDKFSIETENKNGICVTSMFIDGNQVRVGKNKELTSFWVDDNVECQDGFMAANKVAFINGEVIWDECIAQE